MSHSVVTDKGHKHHSTKKTVIEFWLQAVGPDASALRTVMSSTSAENPGCNAGYSDARATGIDGNLNSGSTHNNEYDKMDQEHGLSFDIGPESFAMNPRST